MYTHWKCDLGRVFNIPTLIDIPKRIRFIDIACGFDHTILLAENGDLYSMGMGTYVSFRFYIIPQINTIKVKWIDSYETGVVN